MTTLTGTPAFVVYRYSAIRQLRFAQEGGITNPKSRMPRREDKGELSVVFSLGRDFLDFFV
jgi:hypothetical protein